ncbi:unnamed protein product [Adineta steineri]|uniref:SAM domain-containing protein n=1 Tax=Adineta steineri TaxID=433720 RepID=A0A819B790_9BILA|nr:unnamed protein product [Adineta steineri]CAF3797154.1 unnamed protein product [Adineta steineri]
MNLSPTLPSTKMLTNSTSDDSLREEEHDWKSYLAETKSEAAPAENFKQALIPPENEFNVGEKLESIDPRNQDSWCIGTIIEKEGPRLRIRLDGTDDRNDFWRLVDSGDIRVYGKTSASGGQIVPPLGFQQNSTRWAKYFERYVKDGPFAAESCFKPQPPKPEKNYFKKGQKLEAVDPRHPQMICPATVSQVSTGDRRLTISLDGWSASNDFKPEYSSRDIFPVGWCRLAGIPLAKVGGNPPSRTSNKTLPTTPNKQNGNVRQQSKVKKPVISPISNDSSYSPTSMDEKNNNLTTKSKSKKTSSIKKERRSSNEFNEINGFIKKERPIVTVYLNYVDDNSGMLLNPQKFRFSMPSMFGPGECHTVLATIFNSCIKCAFQQTSFIKRILDIFPTPKEDEKYSYTEIKLDNGTVIYIRQLDTEDDFWDIIRTFQNVILSGNDLFISTLPPIPSNNQSNDSSSSFRDSSLSPDKKQLSPSYKPIMGNTTKRKSTELTSSYSDNTTFISNGKSARSNSKEKSVYDTKPLVNPSPIITNQQNAKTIQNGASHRPERFTPSEVAAFVRGIDPSFDSLAARFLQEEIDGKALLLLTTDTLMRHMGLKLGPSLKIIHHIEKLKQS